MKKMKRYEGGGDVDYDKDTDPEAQKVYRSNLSEVSDEERMPRKSVAAPKKAAMKDDGSYDRKEQRRAMMSGFGGPSKKKPTFGETMRSRARSMVGFSKGGSASKRADGIAQRGKTRGKLV